MFQVEKERPPIELDLNFKDKLAFQMVKLVSVSCSKDVSTCPPGQVLNSLRVLLFEVDNVSPPTALCLAVDSNFEFSFPFT